MMGTLLNYLSGAFNAVLSFLYSLWIDGWSFFYDLALSIFDDVMTGADIVISSFSGLMVFTNANFNVQQYVDLLPSNGVALLSACGLPQAVALVVVAIIIRVKLSILKIALR